jgi:hypothetical protein
MDVNNQLKYSNIAFIAVLHFSVTVESSRIYLLKKQIKSISDFNH